MSAVPAVAVPSPAPSPVTEANRLAESFCVDVVTSRRGFEITGTQRQLLFGLFRRAYLAGHGDGVEKRKDLRP